MTKQQTYTPVRDKPETLRLRGVVPTLTVSDIAQSITWYRDIVGFVVEDEMKHDGKLAGAKMKAGRTRFLLIQDDFAKGRDRQKGQGLRLYCVSAQDVDQLAQDVKSRGGELEQELTDQPWGARDFSLSDPDGFKISISNGMGQDWEE